GDRQAQAGLQRLARPDRLRPAPPTQGDSVMTGSMVGNGPVQTWIVLSFCSAIFFIGLAGVLIRRNILVIMMCIELMLNAVNLTFVAFSKMLGQLGGQL